jgi:hypothetical protein
MHSSLDEHLYEINYSDIIPHANLKQDKKQNGPKKSIK